MTQYTIPRRVTTQYQVQTPSGVRWAPVPKQPKQPSKRKVRWTVAIIFIVMLVLMPIPTLIIYGVLFPFVAFVTVARNPTDDSRRL